MPRAAKPTRLPGGGLTMATEPDWFVKQGDFQALAAGRPMLFFTYDLADYRDRLRGFYFDFEAEAPGPLVETSDDLIDAIRDVETATAGHHFRGSGDRIGGRGRISFPGAWA